MLEDGSCSSEATRTACCGALTSPYWKDRTGSTTKSLVLPSSTLLPSASESWGRPSPSSVRRSPSSSSVLPALTSSPYFWSRWISLLVTGSSSLSTTTPTRPPADPTGACWSTITPPTTLHTMTLKTAAIRCTRGASPSTWSLSWARGGKRCLRRSPARRSRTAMTAACMLSVSRRPCVRRPGWRARHAFLCKSSPQPTSPRRGLSGAD